MKITRDEYQNLSLVLIKESGLHLGEGKEYLVEGRLLPLLEKFGLGCFSEMISRLRLDEFLRKAVVEAMTTNESLFFRDKIPFDWFKDEFLPAKFLEKQDRNLHIWSAACSTGQEPYSLCMSLKDSHFPLNGWNFSILATDISSRSLSRAITGVYSDFEVKRGIDDHHMRKYFKKTGEGWEFDPELRKLVHFRELNLVTDFCMDQYFDLIFCRNVLIYFAPELKKAVIRKLVSHLRPDGFIVFGGAENHCELNDILTRVKSGAPIYRRC